MVVAVGVVGVSGTGGDCVCGGGGSGCVASKIFSSINSNTHVTIWSVNHLPDTASLGVFHVHPT